MNSLDAFTLGFGLGASLLSIAGIAIKLRAERIARHLGYLDGFDAGRAVTRRQLAQATQPPRIFRN